MCKLISHSNMSFIRMFYNASGVNLQKYQKHYKIEEHTKKILISKYEFHLVTTNSKFGTCLVQFILMHFNYQLFCRYVTYLRLDFFTTIFILWNWKRNLYETFRTRFEYLEMWWQLSPHKGWTKDGKKN